MANATPKPREVTIDIETYNELFLAHEKYEALLDVIYNSATLSYNKRHISPDPAVLSNFLFATDYQNYQNTFESLTKTNKGETS